MVLAEEGADGAESQVKGCASTGRAGRVEVVIGGSGSRVSVRGQSQLMHL